MYYKTLIEKQEEKPIDILEKIKETYYCHRMHAGKKPAEIITDLSKEYRDYNVPEILGR